MKKILLICISLVFAVQSNSQTSSLLLSENFGAWSGASPQNLGTTNGWTLAGTGTVDAQVYVLANNTGALVYPGYTAGQNYVRLQKNNNGMEKYKSFTSSVSTSANTTFYMSFLVRMNSAATNVSSTTAAYSLTLHNTANTSYPCRFFIRIDNNDFVEFGISKGSTTTNTYTSNNYDRNGTYLIVIRYDVITGTNNDAMRLWVNPSLVSEPTTGSADLAITSGGDPSYSTTINSLMFHQISGTNSPIPEFDGLRVSYGTGGATTAINSAAAWDQLAPQGAPLPVKLGPLTAFEKNNGVQIDWTAYSEENLDKYVVERSADGSQFFPIGDVDARNVTSESKYGYFDANPLPGISFYRLRNVDIDGKTGLSNIVRVNLSKSVTDLLLYPNPTTNGTISYQSTNLPKGNYSVRIFNAAGQQVYNQRMAHQGGAITQAIQLPSGLQAGLYNLRMESETTIIGTKTFMLQ